MPYIDQEAREKFQTAQMPQVDAPGELNYVITRIVNEYIRHHGGVSYTLLNEVIGVLECTKAELYRRILAPYEDKKIEQNGDVYDCGR